MVVLLGPWDISSSSRISKSIESRASCFWQRFRIRPRAQLSNLNTLRFFFILIESVNIPDFLGPELGGNSRQFKTMTCRLLTIVLKFLSLDFFLLFFLYLRFLSFYLTHSPLSLYFFLSFILFWFVAWKTLQIQSQIPKEYKFCQHFWNIPYLLTNHNHAILYFPETMSIFI